jgi:hypothetical protein
MRFSDVSGLPGRSDGRGVGPNNSEDGHKLGDQAGPLCGALPTQRAFLQVIVHCLLAAAQRFGGDGVIEIADHRTFLPACTVS